MLFLWQVQSDHFENFFRPELEKFGYSVVYKKKTKEVLFNFVVYPYWYAKKWECLIKALILVGNIESIIILLLGSTVYSSF